MLAANLIVTHPPVQKEVSFAQNSLASPSPLCSLQLQLANTTKRKKETNKDLKNKI